MKLHLNFLAEISSTIKLITDRQHQNITSFIAERYQKRQNKANRNATLLLKKQDYGLSFLLSYDAIFHEELHDAMKFPICLSIAAISQFSFILAAYMNTQDTIKKRG